MDSENLHSPAQGELFARLLAAHQRRIYAFLVSLIHDRNSADDVMQEVSTVLWRKFYQFKPDSNFGAWAFQIARLCVFEWRRKQAKLPLPLNDEQLMALAEVSEELLGEFEAREKALHHCLSSLKPADRHLLHLRYYLDQPVSEIAENAGVSRRAIYKTMNRIHGNLLNCVRKRICMEGLV